jgi:hypothetical protein
MAASQKSFRVNGCTQKRDKLLGGLANHGDGIAGFRIIRQVVEVINARASLRTLYPDSEQLARGELCRTLEPQHGWLVRSAFSQQDARKGSGQ